MADGRRFGGFLKEGSFFLTKASRGEVQHTEEGLPPREMLTSRGFVPG